LEKKNDGVTEGALIVGKDSSQYHTPTGA